ncbi:hypothetical protein OQ789_10935 [Mycobacterium sp. 94-17]|nr:hypothetical protein [Mycobacterium sp. 94-17]
MPHMKPQDLPNAGGGRWPMTKDRFRSIQWGDMEVGYTVCYEPADATPLYQLGGFPGKVCQCPHYGYIFEGSIRAVYPDSDEPDEVAVAGEAYFFPAGHVLIYPEPTKALELNPAHALQRCMDLTQSALEKLLGRREP